MSFVCIKAKEGYFLEAKCFIFFLFLRCRFILHTHYLTALAFICVFVINDLQGSTRWQDSHGTTLQLPKTLQPQQVLCIYLASGQREPERADVPIPFIQRIFRVPSEAVPCLPSG